MKKPPENTMMKYYDDMQLVLLALSKSKIITDKKLKKEMKKRGIETRNNIPREEYEVLVKRGVLKEPDFYRGKSG